MASGEEAKTEMTAPANAEDEVKEEKPEKCRCVVLAGVGGLNKVEVQLRSKPKVVEGHVLVKVHACGLNFADIMQRQGLYPGAGPTPYVMGYECSGVVEEVGVGVTEFEVGARVLAISTSFGMMAEYVSVPIINVCAIPDSMSFEDAAAIPLNYVTAYQILFDVGHLKEGESVLIHMAGGGVGVAATQLCKTVSDVTVFGTASKPKHEKITSHGVTHPIDYRNTDYAKEVRKIKSDGVDIVMDPLGGKDTSKGYDLLKPLGRLICYGAANMVKGQSRSIFTVAKNWYQSVSFSPFKLMGDNRSVAGYHAGVLGAQAPHLVAKALGTIVKLYEEEKIKPEVHEVFALEQIRDAMQCMQDRKNVGKVLLSPLKEPPKPEPTKQEKTTEETEEKKTEKCEEKKTEEVEDKKEEDKPDEDGEKKNEVEEKGGEEESKPEENA